MGRGDLAATAKRLFERFLAPLVLGGELTPGPAVGAAAALALDGGLAAVDPDVRSHVDVARVRVARRLLPIDSLGEPSAADWALGGALHDLVHALHPELDSILHRAAPDRVLDFAEQVIEQVSPPASLTDALSRHSFFARVFELQRTDALVSWWTGSRRFLGTDPPPRLLAWPELRKVHTAYTTMALRELTETLASARRERFRRLLGRWLERVPLTDLGNVTRDAAPFAWTGSTLGLFATPGGRVLGLRALRLEPAHLVDAVLGRAVAPFLKVGPSVELARILDVHGERALAVASSEALASGAGLDGGMEVSADAHLARVLGAVVALARVAASPSAAQPSARRVMARLMPLAQTVGGRELAHVVATACTLLPATAPA